MKKRAGRSELRANHIAIAVAAAFGPWFAYGQTPPPNQLPALTLTQGSGQVNAPAGNFLQVDQYSQRAIFSGSMTMGSAGHMNVSQPGSSAIGLFRDVSGSLTQIFGRITANGQIFISNQNGVLFGSTARVEVGGLFASSLSINDSDFMEGRYNWYNDGSAGSVTNQGTIITPSGYTVLAGPQVRNDGLIVARTGTVALAAGDRVALDLIGDGLISVNVDQAALNASAVNTGTIDAEGGKVVLTARSASALLDTVVNAGGVIRASSLVERNGEIILDGGSAGVTSITGTVDAVNVTVRGGTISEAPTAGVFADNLTTSSTGSTTLSGANQVGQFTASSTAGSITLVDAGALEVLGVTTSNGAITLTGDSLTNAGLISNGGGANTANVILSADAFDLAGGTVEGGAAAVIVRPRTGTRSFGIEAAGDTTLTNADIASINTSNFMVFGSGTGTIFTGNMTIGQNAQVDGGTKSLAFFRSSAPGGTTTIGSQGVTTTADAIVSAGGGAIVSNGGTVAGDEIQLRASQGIGSAAARVRTNANALAINNTGGPGAFVSEGGDVTLRNVNLLVGGIANNVFNVIGGGGAYDVTAAGALSVGGLIATTNGAITLTTSSLANSGLITTNGPANTANIVFNADAFNLAGGTVQAGAAAVALRPRTGTNSFGIESAGATTISNADLASIQTDNFIILGSSTGT
ncbi:MAG TPA: filamentous hemagglutinin N-terminal domain-containing protein, partial [Burkholderiales bacterium]|nr:filamentous hemagglutinin N-terminal domain-containing protein [Burkholderiales bacterium]